MMKTALRSIALASILVTASVGIANAANTHASSLSRAQVVAELQAAQQSGEILGDEVSVYPMIPDGPDKSRAQVVATLAAAQEAGHVLGDEASVYPMRTHGSAKSRTQVVNELHAYTSNHSKFIEH
ncbi:DUF4148 domain-containing protein [Pusillimonas sp. ANT_WB101]|nr:DUF4148 domain-containing protein [Pusillimonas sp. ANT_WB101]